MRLSDADATACYIFINSKAAPSGGRHDFFCVENRLADATASGLGDGDRAVVSEVYGWPVQSHVNFLVIC
jgi:hypothetical protein